jgi:squalene-hopene/tetraprenyl-beta-curcumene cyclase
MTFLQRRRLTLSFAVAKEGFSRYCRFGHPFLSLAISRLSASLSCSPSEFISFQKGKPMQVSISAYIFGAIVLLGQGIGTASADAAPGEDWSPQSAAAYLDGRISWWMSWPKAARDHETFCISCHTALPYALGRPALHQTLKEQSPSPTEQELLGNVVKRVRMWKDVEPFYPDQTSGLPKTSESRGTESILDALILVWRDIPTGVLSPDARLALDNMWALQLKTGEMNGSWAWLQFHNAPWEGDSQYWGTTLAAIAIGSAPGNYQSELQIQAGLIRLRTYLVKGMAAQTLLDRAALLWASAKISNLLTKDQREALSEEVLAKQREDGGFSLADMVGSWKRKDNTPLNPAPDGYATGLVAFALEQAAIPSTRTGLSRAIEWLRRNQNPADGRWPASSLNKQRDLESDAGRFMSDAATSYAVLALENAKL